MTRAELLALVAKNGGGTPEENSIGVIVDAIDALLDKKLGENNSTLANVRVLLTRLEPAQVKPSGLEFALWCTCVVLAGALGVTLWLWLGGHR